MKSILLSHCILLLTSDDNAILIHDFRTSFDVLIDPTVHFNTFEMIQPKWPGADQGRKISPATILVETGYGQCCARRSDNQQKQHRLAGPEARIGAERSVCLIMYTAQFR